MTPPRPRAVMAIFLSVGDVVRDERDGEESAIAEVLREDTRDARLRGFRLANGREIPAHATTQLTLVRLATEEPKQ